MFKAYKYRIYPTSSQKELIAKHIGACRFVYNLALETKNTAYLGAKHVFSTFDIMGQIPELKKECPWLKEVSGQSLQQSIRNMDIAFRNFFKGGAFPVFKSKHCANQSFNVPQGVKIEGNRLYIRKFIEGIKIVLHRPIEGSIKNATISVTSTGKYFASIMVDTNTEAPPKYPVKESAAIGIDLGIKNFAVTSDGEVIENPKFFQKALSKLKYAKSKYSKKKGKRSKRRVALLHEKVANQRKDFLQKLSSRLVSENQTICMEDLDIAGMLKEKKLSREVSDAGWGLFVTMLKYKAAWYGNNILQIGRFEPSSKTCSNCGHINKALKLNDRSWTCPNCQIKLDRDRNAAENIKAFALKQILLGTNRKNQDELPALVGVLTPEAHFSE